MYNLILSVIFSVTVCAATPLYPHGPIFGAKNISFEEAPYLVSVRSRSSGHLCSGVFISKRCILTVAHCNVNSAPSFYRIQNATGALYGINNYRSHEKFRETEYGIAEHDLALLKLADSQEYALAPIFMFNFTEHVSAGADAFIANRIGEPFGNNLSARTVQTVDRSLCEKAYEGVGSVPAGLICASYPGAMGREACQGDSGSPLIIEGRLVGILSSGNGCIKPNYPGLYTNIAYYRDWIDEKLRYLEC